MSMDPDDVTSRVSNAERPLPPEIRPNFASGVFVGTAEPGKLIMMTSSAEEGVRMAAVDHDGNWKIDLGAAPRWYTIFRIWARDPLNDATSHVLCYTIAGRRPRMDDVYVSEKRAIGICSGGSEIVAYGPAGQVLGRAFVFGNGGVWSIPFRERLSAGEQVCIIAMSSNGNTSLPFHTAANAFSVDKWNIGEVAGSGALPEDDLTFFERGSDTCVGHAKATHTGHWSLKFDELLSVGKRLQIRRVHKDGAETDGPEFSVGTDPCLAPSVDFASDTAVSGLAPVGTQVICTQYRNAVPIASKTVEARAPGVWSASDFDICDGDNFTATTVSGGGTAVSQNYGSLTVGDDISGMPFIEAINHEGASGRYNPGDFIVAATTELGVISWARVDSEGAWSMEWGVLPSVSPESVMVQFGAYSRLTGNGINMPSSSYAVRYANASSAPPEAPAISNYDVSLATFKGTESTANTVVNIKDTNHSWLTVAKEPVLVQNNDWTLVADTIPHAGDIVLALAYQLQNGSLGVTSDYSSPPFVVPSS